MRKQRFGLTVAGCREDRPELLGGHDLVVSRVRGGGSGLRASLLCGRALRAPRLKLRQAPGALRRLQSPEEVHFAKFWEQPRKSFNARAIEPIAHHVSVRLRERDFHLVSGAPKLSSFSRPTT